MGFIKRVITFRILLVDDNQDAALILKMLLVLKGYKVDTCNNGQHALLLAEQNLPNVILFLFANMF